MKKLVMLFSLAVFVSCFAAAQISRGGTVFVATRTLALKSSAWFFAGTRGTLEYGDRVTVLRVSGDWIEVRSVTSPSLSGWARSSSLSLRQLVPENEVNVTPADFALARRGFNQELENAYRSGRNLNYADVDIMEALYINEAQLYWFIEEGRLADGRN